MNTHIYFFFENVLHGCKNICVKVILVKTLKVFFLIKLNIVLKMIGKNKQTIEMPEK